MRRVAKGLLLLLLIFLVPAAASMVWWLTVDRPGSWREANWGSSGVLPPAARFDGAVVHIMAARTGGMKGALSQHTWIVTKRAGEERYTRYDKVGWGRPVRVNAYAADAYWYSNLPYAVHTVKGDRAEALIPEIEKAVRNYPHSVVGGYHIWPGPNSNSFVAHVLREVPDIGASLPPNAVGRDHLAGGRWWYYSSRGWNVTFSAGGLFGISAGELSGIEVNFLGLVAGFDFRDPALKVPGFGRIPLKP